MAGIRTLMILACALALSACGSMSGGAVQTVTVDTMPMPGASCTLTNPKGVWHVPRTPGSVTLANSGYDLTVSCRDEHGAGGEVVAPAKLADVYLGNVLLGGAIGMAVDMSTGGAYTYDPRIIVTMRPGGGRTAQRGSSLPGRRASGDPSIVPTPAGRAPDPMFERRQQTTPTAGFCCGPLRP